MQNRPPTRFRSVLAAAPQDNGNTDGDSAEHGRGQSVARLGATGEPRREGHSPWAGHGPVATANLLCPGSRASLVPRATATVCPAATGPCHTPRVPLAIPDHPGPSCCCPSRGASRKGPAADFPLEDANTKGCCHLLGALRAWPPRDGQGSRTDQPGWGPGCAGLRDTDAALSPCSACQPPGRPLWPLPAKNTVLQRSPKEDREKDTDLPVPQVLYYSGKPPDQRFHLQVSVRCPALRALMLGVFNLHSHTLLLPTAEELQPPSKPHSVQ